MCLGYLRGRLTSVVVLQIPAAGDYYLAFYAGSYDRSGGTVLGATLTVKGFRLLPKTCKVRHGASPLLVWHMALRFANPRRSAGSQA